MVTHSSILTWRTAWAEEPGRLWSVGSHRSWSDLACMQASTCLEEEQAAFGCWSHSSERDEDGLAQRCSGARGMWTDWRFSLEIRGCFPHLPCLICLSLCLFYYLWMHFLKVDLIYCYFVTAVFMNNLTWYWVRFSAVVHWTIAIARSYPVSAGPKRSLVCIWVCVTFEHLHQKKFLLNVFTVNISQNEI